MPSRRDVRRGCDLSRGLLLHRWNRNEREERAVPGGLLRRVHRPLLFYVLRGVQLQRGQLLPRGEHLIGRVHGLPGGFVLQWRLRRCNSVHCRGWELLCRWEREPEWRRVPIGRRLLRWRGRCERGLPLGVRARGVMGVWNWMTVCLAVHLLLLLCFVVELFLQGVRRHRKPGHARLQRQLHVRARQLLPEREHGARDGVRELPRGLELRGGWRGVRELHVLAGHVVRRGRDAPE